MLLQEVSSPPCEVLRPAHSLSSLMALPPTRKSLQVPRGGLLSSNSPLGTLDPLCFASIRYSHIAHLSIWDCADLSL